MMDPNECFRIVTTEGSRIFKKSDVKMIGSWTLQWTIVFKNEHTVTILKNKDNIHLNEDFIKLSEDIDRMHATELAKSFFSNHVKPEFPHKKFDPSSLTYSRLQDIIEKLEYEFDGVKIRYYIRKKFEAGFVANIFTETRIYVDGRKVYSVTGEYPKNK